MMGREMGSIRVKKMRNSPAPSIRAACRSSSGTVMKYWRNMKMPVAVMIDGIMMPARLLQPQAEDHAERRRHDDLGGQHGGCEDAQEECLHPAVAVLRQRETRACTHEHGEHGGHHSDERGVQEVGLEVEALPGGSVPAERPVLGKEPERPREEFAPGLEGAQQEPCSRDEEQQGEGPHGDGRRDRKSV